MGKLAIFLYDFSWNIVSRSPAHSTFDNGMSNILKSQVIEKCFSIILAACFFKNNEQILVNVDYKYIEFFCVCWPTLSLFMI